MATKVNSVRLYIAKKRKKGKAAKNQQSSSKGSKNYVKPYRGQGR